MHLSSRPGYKTEHNDEKSEVWRKWYQNLVIIDSPPCQWKLIWSSYNHPTYQQLRTHFLTLPNQFFGSQLAQVQICLPWQPVIYLAIIWVQSILQWASVTAPAVVARRTVKTMPKPLYWSYSEGMNDHNECTWWKRKTTKRMQLRIKVRNASVMFIHVAAAVSLQ